jgi:hypothetical protein
MHYGKYRANYNNNYRTSHDSAAGGAPVIQRPYKRVGPCAARANTHSQYQVKPRNYRTPSVVSALQHYDTSPNIAHYAGYEDGELVHIQLEAGEGVV